MPTVFSRHPAAPTLRGVVVHSIPALREALGSAAVVSDLSMGAWRGNHTAREWCEQLGIALPPQASPAITFQVGGQGQLSYADSIGELVDAETRGDLAALFALWTAASIVRHAGGQRQCFFVLAPRFGLPWEPENELLLRLVAQGLPDRVVVIAAGGAVSAPARFRIDWTGEPAEPPPALPIPKSPWVLFPGLLPSTAPRQDWALSLPGGGYLIAPWVRPNPAAHSRLSFDALAAEAAGMGWPEAFAHYYGNAMFADCGLLCEQAQQRFMEGGYDVAFRLLERAASCAPSAAQKTLAIAAMQGMRIAIHRFADAAAAPEPPPGAPAELAQFLRQSKGWGLVMTGRAAESSGHFQRALEHPAGAGSERERLYLRNIAALSAARLGDLEAALETELDIERQLARLPSPDWHLLYINSLNLARLYRRKKQFDSARACYQRAFATMEGGRSGSDGLYGNLTFAQLEGEAGNAELARRYWLRAAMHWVSCEEPEALAWRVATALLGRPVGPGQMVDEEASACLRTRLEQIFPAVVPAGRPAVFVRAEPAGEWVAAVGEPGWGVLLSLAQHHPPSTGEEHARLRARLAAILGVGDAYGTIGVPDCHGREMPTTCGELLAVCLECGVRQLVFAGQPVAADPERWAGRLRVALAPLFSAWTPEGTQGVAVTFKRYRQPEHLTGSAARLIACLGPEQSFAELVAQGYSAGLIRSLEERRILRLYLAD